MALQKIYPPGVPNQEFAPLEVKNEKTGTVGKSRSLSGQVLWETWTGSDMIKAGWLRRDFPSQIWEALIVSDPVHDQGWLAEA